MHFHHRALRIVKHGATIALIHRLPVVDTLIRMKEQITNDELDKLDAITKLIDEQMGQLEMEYQ